MWQVDSPGPEGSMDWRRACSANVWALLVEIIIKKRFLFPLAEHRDEKRS